jgi:hypothetical protein
VHERGLLRPALPEPNDHVHDVLRRQRVLDDLRLRLTMTPKQLAEQVVVEQQGKVVVERDADGPGYHVMFPDGHVRYAMTTPQAAYMARQWFKQHLRSFLGIGVGYIEWRNCQGLDNA